MIENHHLQHNPNLRWYRRPTCLPIFIANFGLKVDQPMARRNACKARETHCIAKGFDLHIHHLKRWCKSEKPVLMPHCPGMGSGSGTYAATWSPTSSGIPHYHYPLDSQYPDQYTCDPIWISQAQPVQIYLWQPSETGCTLHGLVLLLVLVQPTLDEVHQSQLGAPMHSSLSKSVFKINERTE